MEHRTLKSDAPHRDVTEVGKGDYIKTRGGWHRIAENSAEGAARLPRDWTVRTESGLSVGMFNINRYAKAEDLD